MKDLAASQPSTFFSFGRMITAWFAGELCLDMGLHQILPLQSTLPVVSRWFRGSRAAKDRKAVAVNH